MVVEKAQDTRLKKLGLNIKTKYKVGDEVRERNSDDSLNQNVKDAIIIEKDYYKGILLHKENIFDSRILYTYDFDGDEKFTCKNCGMEGLMKDFEDECPYCHTNYNVEYQEKSMGSKNYYDYVIKDKSYVIKTCILDFIVSLIIVSFLVIPNSRTFYIFDILKVLGLTVVVSFILFFVFYYVDAFFLLPNLKRKKELSNKRQEEFWKKMESLGVEKTKFFNNIIYELREYYYSDKNPNVIDFDIIDYDEFNIIEKDNCLYVDVLFDIRVVEFINNKVVSNRSEISFKFKRLKEFKELEKGTNHMPCPSCGSSIDARSSECSYCGRKINYLQEWYLEK